MTDKPLPDPGLVFPTKPISAGDQEKGGGMSAAGQPFSSFMAKPPSPTTAPSHVTSPFALMQGGGGTPMTTTPNVDALIGQMNKTQGTVADIHNQLSTPGLKLKASTKYLLKNKLSEANDNFHSLNTKIGVTNPSEPTSNMTGPFGKFVNYLAHGQQMMNAAKMQLQNIKADGTSMSPGDFLLVQLKMNKAQQLLEFSSVLLSTAVSDIKQFMQIQI